MSKYPNLCKIKAYSDQFLISAETNHYDFIYIDGDHTASTVISDAVLAWELLKVNGIMAFDDYEWTHPDGDTFAPKVAIDGFLNIFNPYLEVINRGWQIWIRRIK